MTSIQAREQRRQAIAALHKAMGTIARESLLNRSIETADALATAYQSIGRLIAIDEQEAVTEERSAGRPARSPRPSIIPDVPEITREMEVDSSFRLAWEAAFMTGDPNELEDMGEAWDRGDDGAIRAIVNKVKLNGRP